MRLPPSARAVLALRAPAFGTCSRGGNREETKSTGVVNRLVAEGGNPQADVFWSGDPVRLFLLLKRGLVEPYVSPQAQGLPAGLRSRDGSWTGVAARARVLLVNRKLVAETLYEVEDATFAGPGRIGVRTKADSVTHFDDLKLTILK